MPKRECKETGKTEFCPCGKCCLKCSRGKEIGDCFRLCDVVRDKLEGNNAKDN